MTKKCATRRRRPLNRSIITLAAFVPFALYYMQQPLKLNYLWASLCMCGAAYFIFRT